MLKQFGLSSAAVQAPLKDLVLLGYVVVQLQTCCLRGMCLCPALL